MDSWEKLLADKDPNEVLDLLDKADSEDHLIDFTKTMWRFVEPAREFVGNWHIDAICEHLEAVTDGEITRLLINVPPGSMKSLTTNVFWPAWEWGPQDKPSLRYIAASYSEKLTVRDNIRFRQIMMADKYRRLWGDVFGPSKDQFNITKVANDRTGFKLATSVGGVGTGERGDRFIIDDPHNVLKGESEAVMASTLQWFTEVVPTRLTDPMSSAIIVIMQRVAEADVSGHILAKELGYEHLMIPLRYESDRKCVTSIGWVDPREEEGELMWPERMPLEVVERDESVMGEYAVAGQFQQIPEPRGGGIFKRDWWRVWPEREEGESDEVFEQRAKRFPPMDYIVASFDGAYTEKTENDYCALTIWGVFRDRGGVTRLMLMDAWKERLELNACVEKVGNSCRRFKVDKLLIEAKATGISVAQELRRLFSKDNWSVHMTNPKSDKVARAVSVQHLFSGDHRLDKKTGKYAWVNGMVFAPDRAWADMVIDEMARFPKGAHDDLTDTVTQALRYLRQFNYAPTHDERTGPRDAVLPPSGPPVNYTA